MLELNTRTARQGVVTPEVAQIFSLAAARQADADMRGWLGHTPSPLHSLPHLAGVAGVASIAVKDESQRLGMNSFKALGGAYAVFRLVLEEAGARLGRALPAEAIATEEVRAVAAGITVSCATDGNHGRSVAEGAMAAGCNAVIFVHEGVDPERVAAIKASGARVITVPGSYDHAVAEATRVCAREGWHVVSDTSWPGYETTPLLVMQGYTILVQEALAAQAAPPTHVFLQAGVGGFAAAVAAHMAVLFGAERPRLVVVEPQRAACLFESNRAGALTSVEPGEPTCMAMLECYSPSMVAWAILSELADGFMTLDEPEAVAVMNLLAKPQGGDPAVVSGESGGAGLSGLLQAARDETARGLIGLGPESRVLVFNTEGATAPRTYERLTGLSEEQVRLGASR